MRLKLLYFVHDLSDAAILRRVQMLERCNCDLTLLGFTRGRIAPELIASQRVICLGQTKDARFLQRIWSMITAWPKARRLVRGNYDLVLCRNLEMLILAMSILGPQSRRRLIYECLDIHRLMIGRGFFSFGLALVEWFALSFCKCIIVSSPAFAASYFLPRYGFSRPVIILENKALFSSDQTHDRREKRPIKIGWFGILRCRRSFDHLKALALHRPDLVQIKLAGRPFLDVFPDLKSELSDIPGLTFSGAYASHDTVALYASIDLVWCIDFFEAGFNSKWLLPNRLYDCLANGKIPIALADTEVGHWLRAAKVGLVLDDLNDLEQRLELLAKTGFQPSPKLDPSRVTIGPLDFGNLSHKLNILSGELYARE